MSTRMLIAEQWDQFARAVLPAGCHPLQKQEMRRAFYAGAKAILIAASGALDHTDEPTDNDLAIMTGIHQELMGFASMVKEGRA